MALGKKKLDRIHKVRTLQLGLVRAEEVRANERFASEVNLRNRIAQLTHDIAPTPTAGQGLSMIAAAHFRDRLQQSAEAADGRMRAAEHVAALAAEKTREAKRDQSAIEKLLARAEADAALRGIRALEAAPPSRKIRHDPC
jgi:flagellar FliJ protein